MMRVLIIEDETPAAEKLQRMLLEANASINIVGKVKSVEQTVLWLKSNELPDLITMDVQLSDGICFEIFDQISVEIPVIFTTAYDEYALNAFKVNSIDYLLKPIDSNDLKKALAKFEKVSFNSKHQKSIVKEVKEILKAKKRFLVKAGSTYHSILVDEIEYFYISERNTFIKTYEGKHYGLDVSLDQVVKELDPSQFFRINRNYILNIDAIAKMISFSSSRLKVILHSKEKKQDLIVSRDKVAEFKKWMGW